ncbi:DRMBL-domain-containing protein [Xylariomycetidae sp. FL2044]|nr:DRMBL-domain-containing protein [Xylariomycetidae sp. FL2044]
MPAAKAKAKPKSSRTQSKLNFGPAKSPAAKTPNGKNATSNGNILNFFKKVEVEEELFCRGSPNAPDALPITQPVYKSHVSEDIYGTEDEVAAETISHDREQNAPKRRKLSHDGTSAALVTPMAEPKEKSEEKTTVIKSPKEQSIARRRSRAKAPFLADSDSDDESGSDTPTKRTSAHNTPDIPVPEHVPTHEASPLPNLPADQSCPDPPDLPPLKQEETYHEEFQDLENIEGLFDDDEFDDGEEFRERRYMEEQARLEAEDAGNYIVDGIVHETTGNEGMTESCPLCNASLAGISSEQASVHVNACLDGNPMPPPVPEKPPPPDTIDAPELGKRFARAAVPRPGQANPITLEGTASQPTSAFSKLMSGHAEDAAWASAAATEHASRGKPAYQRTCPFYKIMPGFYICVDAFRYGAVKGCNAYFLSHFHSDHYIGLTANWSHGPIYCSKVTGSLVKNQLRTAVKWVKELEFEETVVVPGTEGVTVTMLPANHCPGSSLFLFEKNIGKGPVKRMQRILHCGDFRACPAQVNHPLLKPETVDAISGKVRQQKIDICYLDTTYLNPRYSFPPQDDVIRACAEFCKSISGDPAAANEAFDALRREKGSTSVSKFFQREDANSTTGGLGSGGGGGDGNAAPPKNRLLVICGTYSIGKERICKAIAQALGTKIFASPSKIKLCRQLGDSELTSLLTSNPREAQVHMQMLMEIRAETLQDYLDSYKPHFTRIVGFRPSGWSFRNNNTTAKAVPASTSPASLPTTSILHGPDWRPRFGRGDFVAQRGSTREAMCFGVPYSEHSSFRELALFLMALRIEKVVPTVNVGSEVGRRRMKGWTDRWVAERRKGGVVRVLLEEEEERADDEAERSNQDKDKDKNKNKEFVLWDGKDGRGGGVWW